ncbi:MAG: FoF1 ATP synthase subunit a [Candidatus Babeliales bacterium]
MTDIDFFSNESWNLLGWLSIDHPLFHVNKVTLINSWIALGILWCLCVWGRYSLRRTGTKAQYLCLQTTHSLMDFTEQTVGFFSYQHCSVAAAFFTFVLLCNCIAIIPWTSEPTKDLNTTLAFGISVFLYTDWQAIRAHGLKNFLKEFIDPTIFMLPMNIIGHFSKVVSISFRLFGNIFGGAVIMELYQSVIESHIIAQIIGIMSGFNIIVTLFFGLFEGLIQAAVFGMLSLTYLSLALQKEHHD